MEAKPKRSEKWKNCPHSLCEHNAGSLKADVDVDVGSMVLKNKVESKKYFDDDQVKLIWENAFMNEEDLNIDVYEYDQNQNGDNDDDHDKFEDDRVTIASTSLTFESDEGHENVNVNVNVNEEEVEWHEFSSVNGDQDFEHDDSGKMDWKQMYPIRKSLYNRKTHFISFLQNYTRYDMGRKLMSDYENTMSGFILENMKPKTSQDFLKMLKECKLSNVYRFYDHIYKQRFKSIATNEEQIVNKDGEIDITTDQIERVVHMFNMFQAFFHRQEKFNRKNFLSMRFLIGRIFVYIGLVSSYEVLPADLQRPKGRTQFMIHERIWKLFLDSLVY